MGYVIEVRHLVAPTAPSPTLIIGTNTKKTCGGYPQVPILSVRRIENSVKAQPSIGLFLLDVYAVLSNAINGLSSLVRTTARSERYSSHSYEHENQLFHCLLKFLELNV